MPERRIHDSAEKARDTTLDDGKYDVRIDASFRKAHRWKLTYKQYKFDDLLSEVDSKLFACRPTKVETSFACRKSG